MDGNESLIRSRNFGQGTDILFLDYSAFNARFILGLGCGCVWCPSLRLIIEMCVWFSVDKYNTICARRISDCEIFNIDSPQAIGKNLCVSPPVIEGDDGVMLCVTPRR